VVAFLTGITFILVHLFGFSSSVWTAHPWTFLMISSFSSSPLTTLNKPEQEE
jgi:hypothetical protein